MTKKRDIFLRLGADGKGRRYIFYFFNYDSMLYLFTFWYNSFMEQFRTNELKKEVYDEISISIIGR